MKQLKDSAGFTVIEFLVLLLIVLTAGFLALTSLRANRAGSRDDNRKSDINAVYFQLESFHEKNGYYPKSADKSTLVGVDEQNLTDPHNIKLGETGSEYVYETFSCADVKCKSFKLSTNLEREATFEKESLNR